MSIQQRISSDVYHLANQAVTPEQIKSVQAHITRGVQDGSVPSYVGIPLLNDLNQKMASIHTAPAASQAMTNQPPIAEQVMGQARQGLENLPTNLPEQGFAPGGIIGGEDPSDYFDDDQAQTDEDEEEDYLQSALEGVQPRSG